MLSASLNKTFLFLPFFYFQLEKYSINLEDVLAERTKLLLEEKEKKLKVLGELVPVPTLQQLKCGRVLEPETFLSVTILVW